MLIIFANVISERVENIKVMNNFSKLSVFDESSRVGNILHETICSLSSKRLSCRIVFGKENYDLGVGFAKTGNTPKKEKKVKPGMKPKPSLKQSSFSSPSKSSTSGIVSANRRSPLPRRSPNKSGKFVRAGAHKPVCNVYSMRIKYSEFLLVFAEDGKRPLLWNFPGTQKKAWATAFDRAIRDENAWPTGESPILNIVTRRDVRDEDDDVPLPQLSAPQYSMNAYLCFIGPDDTPAGISNAIVTKINEYARVKVNNMKQFKYFGEVTEDFSNENLHALDYWVITRDVVSTVNDIYEEELLDDTFFEFPLLVGGLFERQPDVRVALGGQFQG